jgi:hydroxyacylglutathione hydrolase
MTQSMLKVTAIPAFTDNYIWAIESQNSNQVALVDPGDATVCMTYLARQHKQLVAIIITHHHADHTGGIKTLTATYPNVNVYGPNNPKILGITHPLQEQDTLTLFNDELTLTVWSTPGHTLDHIVYFNETALFCGDTLFSCGCGRLFEGSAEQMTASLAKIKTLNKAINVYCAHEYTLANIAFAQHIEPENDALAQYHQHVLQLRAMDQPSIPTTLATELAVNPFLRCDQPSVMKHCSTLTAPNETEVFRYLRQLKDHF